ncbi:MAG: ribosomal L7Ae/L30e/S12e/Gadd45 family protein [Clostridiales bacterium]|jgi:ribosomal protein L7Ae-like RNA K-turn-binding protein|nr:ribosomal L7Ae/L30e/S12e/Gadd45 family protein [Clostridiales bacterium]
MDDKRLLSMISLARKAGKIVTGEEGCVKAIQSGAAQIVLVAVDASHNTKKKFANKAAHYKVPFYSLFTKEVMGGQIGMSNRATICVVDAGFAAKIADLAENLNKERVGSCPKSAFMK